MLSNTSLSALVLSILLLLTACSGKREEPATPADNSVNPSSSEPATDDGRPWEFEYHAADNATSLQPVTVENQQFNYSFAADAESTLTIIDEPIGAVSVVSLDGAIALSVPQTQEGFAAAVLTEGSWNINYQPDKFDAGTPPLVLVQFDRSRYYLHTDKSSKQATAEGRTVLFEAYITQVEYIANSEEAPPRPSATESDQAIKPSEGNFSLRIELPNGQQRQFQLNDDGRTRFGDNNSGDGVFSAIVDLTAAGNYRFVVLADAKVNGKPVQREVSLSDSVAPVRAYLVSETAHATPDLVFEQTLSEGQYGIPILVTLEGDATPDFLNVAGEIWATDNLGETIRIVDRVSGIVRPEFRSAEVFGLALIIPADVVPRVGRFEGVRFKLTHLSTLDSGENILAGKREFLLTGLPE